MDSDDRSSTASTVSGIYRNLLQSPAPICMFYFAHPFGISTPIKSKTQNKSTNYRIQPTPNKENYIKRQATKTRSKYYNPSYDKQRLSTMTPWPRNYVLPPLLQLLAVQKGNHVDLEATLKTIHSAWNTPKSRTFTNSRARDFSESSLNSASSCHNARKMGSGTNCTMVAPGLLRRRYSLPEIIMRKHSLAQQKSNEQSVASSAPTPHHSPVSHKLNSSHSSITSSGSDMNISRNGDRETSMRRQLLRRIWSKEFRQYSENRSGSWSPPMRRSQRRLHMEVPDRCKECSKLEQACVLASPKRLRLHSSPIASAECLQSSTYSTKSNRITSSSERPAYTSCSGGTTEISSSSDGDIQQEVRKNVFVCTTSMDESSVDENRDDNYTPVLQVDIVDEMQPTPSTNADDADNIVDSDHRRHDGHDSTNDESINDSRTEDEENENRINLSRNTNGNTTAETIEENGNDVESVDQYVSTLLVNSLNSLMDTVNEPLYITPNKMTNRCDYLDNMTSSFKVDENENDTTVSNPECDTYEAVETQTENSKSSKLSDYVESSIINDNLDIQNANIIDVVDENRVIYFPQYTTESKDDESIYSTQLSEEDFLDSHSPNTIPVQSGSTYPNYDCAHAVVLARSVHRTESMEAEPSSASPREDQGGNDSDASLVDSLDEPISLKVEKVTNEIEPTICPIVEKSQSFFVPIADTNEYINDQINVASAMPEKLREKLMKRQQDMDTKKKQEINKKQKKIQKIIDRNQVVKEAEDLNGSNKSKSPSTKSSIITKQDSRSSTSTLGNNKGNKNKFLRSEVGMLESYRIDSRGNMQFNIPQKQSDSGNSLVKNSLQTVKKSLPRKGDIITIKRSQTKKSTIDNNHRRKEVIKDVQHMTLYQVQPDLMTPDTECGPRRMYQKTEIHDGEKRIEILEIVECVDSCSSADGSGSPHEVTYRTRSACLTRKSKIPIPVYKTGQSIGLQKSVKCASRDSGCPGKIFIKNIQQLGNHTKVDQMIADLLIEALNHPKEMGIEFVKSPKEFSRGGSGSGKRPLISRRSMTGFRRSAGGTKYQQVFEVIPEEKSSFSVESSVEESNISGQTSNLMNESQSTSAQNISTSSTTSDSKISQKRIPRGKEAIESDLFTESEAWVGFFKQHDDSLVDSGNEDDHKEDSNASISTSDSPHHKTVKIIEKPTKTISQFNSPQSSTAFTPISSSDIFVSSSGSDNIFTVINKTFSETPENDILLDVSNSISVVSDKETICTECNLIDKELEDHVDELEVEQKKDVQSDIIVDEIDSFNSAVNVESIQEDIPRSCGQEPNVWQVDDITNYKPLKRNSPRSPPDPLVTNADIDSTSFIVLHGDENVLLKNSKLEDLPLNSRDRCSDCCFCNPDLHGRDGALSSASCNFCNKRSTSKVRGTETKGTNTARVYESLTKRDHTHVRTKSKESDTVSLKCTKINSKIRRFIPEDRLNGNVCEDTDENINKIRSSKIDLSKKPPKPPTISPVRKDNAETISPSHKAKNKTKTTSGVRLPSPFVTGISSHSYDSSSSQSSSCSPSSPKKYPILPTGRWQNSGGQKQLNKSRTSRYKEFYGENEKSQVANKNDSRSPGQNTGWSLTLAGTYNDDMAPDVEMRLSFPKKTGKGDCGTSSFDRKILNSHKHDNGNYRHFNREQSDLSNENCNSNNRASLPTTVIGNINPKRTLSKTIIDKNRNIKNYNLPDLNPFNGTVAEHTARKTIKRSEYSVAVASATRTISNFSNGKQRAMSFQALNANAYRFDNRDRRRDHSLDLGNLSSRRMSIDSQTPSEAMALSVLGNAIAPEQKPRVPTMSERDLTRKHNSCFTRNRSFLS